MVQCFVPCCNHRFGGVGQTCTYHRFPTDETTRRWWTRAVGRDRKPTEHSRICSCHFPEGRARGPILFKSKDGTICKEHKIPKYGPTPPIKSPNTAHLNLSLSHNKFVSSDNMLCIGRHQLMGLMECIPSNNVPVVGAMVCVETTLSNDTTLEESISDGTPVIMTYIPPVESADVVSPVVTKVCPSVATQTDTQASFAEVEKILLQAELKDVKEELTILKLKLENFERHYTPSRLSDEVVMMETGLPDRDCFNKIVECATNLENTISYDAGWKIRRLSIQDQVFLTLMKLRHNYKDFHLGALFSCSQAAIRNVINTWTDILQALLQDDYPPATSSAKAQKTPVSENTRALHTNIQIGSTTTASDFLSTSDHIYYL